MPSTPQQANCPGLVVVSEDDHRPLLLHRIAKEDIYHRRAGWWCTLFVHCWLHLVAPSQSSHTDDTIITWSDSNMGTDIALSFAEDVGCNLIWYVYTCRGCGGCVYSTWMLAHASPCVHMGCFCMAMHAHHYRDNIQRLQEGWNRPGMLLHMGGILLCTCSHSTTEQRSCIMMDCKHHHVDCNQRHYAYHPHTQS